MRGFIWMCGWVCVDWCGWVWIGVDGCGWVQVLVDECGREK